MQPYLCSGVLGTPVGKSGQGFGVVARVAESRNRSGFSMGGENLPAGAWNWRFTECKVGGALMDGQGGEKSVK